MSSKIFVDPLIGNVGIGTGLPSAQFHTNSTNGGRPLQIEQTASNVEFPPLGASNVGYYADYSDTVPSIDVGTPLTLVEYPPVALSSATTTAGPITINVAGAFYGNGNYVVTASSVYDSTGYGPWKGFNKTPGAEAWISTGGTYNTTTPYAATSGGPTTVSGTSYTGAFLQMQLPDSIILKSYSIRGLTANIGKWVIAGSTNGTSWSLVDSKEWGSWVPGTDSYFSTSNTSSYAYYRIIILNMAAVNGYAVMVEWRLFADTPLPTTAREYPPLPMTANTSYLNGTYGAGTYVASASSRYADNTTDAFNVFDKFLTSSPIGLWASADFTYSSGLPTALSKTTIISGITYFGEYVQLKTPNSIIVSSYSVAPRSDILFYPVDWRLAGSTDSVIWDLLDTQTNKTSWVANVYQNFNISMNRSYKYYRFVITKAQTLYGVVSLGEIKLFTNQSTYPKYRTLLPATSSTYNPGTYSTYANTIYNATTIDATPPTFISDKILSSPWKTGANTYTNAADANPIPSIFFELPQAILLKSYQLTAPDTATAPSSWNVYGSNMGVAGGWVLTDGPRTSQIAPWTTSLTQTYNTTGSTTYNMFKFDLLRNTSASANFIALNEIRLNGNDVLPDARITVNADGRVGINTPLAEINTGAAMTVSGNIAVTGNISAGNLGMFRNRIINGDMRIDQRYAGVSTAIAAATTSVYIADRWRISNGTTSAALTMQRVRAPANPYGYVYALSAIATTAQATMNNQDYVTLEQRIEGYNIADFGWGTTYAQPITVSFAVYSTQAGQYSLSLRNATNTMSYVALFTVPVANQWVQVQQTVPGETSGTWEAETAIGLSVAITLAAGSNWLTSGVARWQESSRAPSGFGYIAATGGANFMGTVNNQFYLTGVQVEKGTIMTPFEVRPFGVELGLCQRYCEKTYNLNIPIGAISTIGFVDITASGNGSGVICAHIKFSTAKCTIPSISGYNISNGTNTWSYINSGGSSTNTFAYDYASTFGFRLTIVATVAWSTGEIQGHWVAISEL